MATAILELFKSIRQLVEMSVGTDRGRWWADPEFGSDLWKIRQEGKIGTGTAKRVKDAIERSVAWLVADGLAESIQVVAEQVGKNAIAWAVTVTQPNGKSELVKDVWNAL